MPWRCPAENREIQEGLRHRHRRFLVTRDRPRNQSRPYPSRSFKGLTLSIEASPDRERLGLTTRRNGRVDHHLRRLHRFTFLVDRHLFLKLDVARSTSPIDIPALKAEIYAVWIGAEVPRR